MLDAEEAEDLTELRAELRSVRISSAVQKEVVPILWRMEVTTEKLLRNFVQSKEQQRLAESKGMKEEHLAALIKAYEPRNYAPFAFAAAACILLVWFVYPNSRPSRPHYSIFESPVRKCGMGLDFTEYKAAEIEVRNLFHSTNRIRIEGTKVKDLTLKNQKNGYLCVDVQETSSKLVATLQSTMHALWVAAVLNRTLVVPNVISSVYNAKKWQNMFPGTKYKMVVPYRAALCPAAGPFDTSPDMTLQQLTLRTRAHKSFSLGSSQLTKFFAFDSSFVRSFYSNVWPRKEIVNVVDRYIYDNFGDRPYAAVHLRWFKGACKQRMIAAGNDPLLCSPTRDVAESIMKKFTMQSNIPPVFVLSDNENQAALQTYSKDFFYKGNCQGVDCIVINYEIAARANFFVGIEIAKASVLIALLRNHRQLRNGIFHPNVLQWSNATDVGVLQNRWFTKTPNNVKYCPNQTHFFIE